MKYCSNCGAELPDEAKFCGSCGTPVTQPEREENSQTVTARTSDDGKGIVIDAPEDATVTISDTKDEPGWKSLIVKNLWIFIKVLLIAVGAVLAGVLIKDFFTDDGQQSDTPNNPQEISVQQQSTDIDNQEPPAVAKPNHPVVQNDEETTILNEQEEGGDGFGRLDDIPLHEKAEYMERLLEQSEAELNSELAKGSSADLSKITQLRNSIAEIRQALSRLKQ